MFLMIIPNYLPARNRLHDTQMMGNSDSHPERFVGTASRLPVYETICSEWSLKLFFFAPGRLFGLLFRILTKRPKSPPFP